MSKIPLKMNQSKNSSQKIEIALNFRNEIRLNFYIQIFKFIWVHYLKYLKIRQIRRSFWWTVLQSNPFNQKTRHFVPHRKVATGPQDCKVTGHICPVYCIKELPFRRRLKLNPQQYKRKLFNFTTAFSIVFSQKRNQLQFYERILSLTFGMILKPSTLKGVFDILQPDLS